ncbi:MAG: S8 family serine peptidase, partial [Acidobacteriota bacterium]|nr:S8 family serine peptidase [Acidobacteriota bacterium]
MRLSVVLFTALLLPAAAFARDLARYAVVLSDAAPISARTRDGRAAVESARLKVVNAQDNMKRELRRRGIAVSGEARTFLNAVFVAASPAEAEQLKLIPGVAQVAPLHRFQLSLDKAEQLINVPAAWNLVGGAANAGAGVKIGIIDTGIQATHPAFQNFSASPPAGFPICRVTYSTSTNAVPSDCAATDTARYTNNKVIVARSYVPLLSTGAAATSRPDDPSPRDRVGHGTAVAMAAAGLTNTGPSDTITGVAPGAFLGSYKVFGSPGVSEFTSGEAVIEAIEDAYADGMDIVVLSLGAPALSGPLDSGAVCGLTAGQQCDAEAYVVQAAVNAGMVVVAAAGNQGGSGLHTTAALSTIASPGDAPGAIAVAASTNSHSW